MCKLSDVVPASKSGQESVLMFVHSSFEIVGYTDVERCWLVRQDVDVVLVFAFCGYALEIPHCVRNDTH